MNLLINIDVDDLPKAIAFYTQAFNLIVGRRFGDGAAEMLGGPVPLYLLVKATGSNATDVPEVTRCYDRHWTPVHLDVVVTDIDAAMENAMGAGATLDRPTQFNKWGKIALMADPFGNGFCLIQFVGKGYDEIATQEEGARVVLPC